jgi:hypothetical protein
MIGVLRFVLSVVVSPFRSKARLEAEIAVLRQQLIVLRRTSRGRVRLTNGDRWFFVQLYRLCPSILQALRIIRPETLVRWHRAGFRCYWHWKSRRRGGRPQIDAELRGLIAQMSAENPLWGAPRIHGELLKLGFEVAQSTVAKAFPWDSAPGYLIRDRDRAFGPVVRHRLRAMGIRDKPIAPHSPWQNGFAERLIGSIRRECLDHTIVFGEAHLRRLLTYYASYYNQIRTHRALQKDAPLPR